MHNFTVALNGFTEYDVTLFQAGKHFQLYEKLGAHLITHKRKKGVHFAVYAPGAREVQVIGDFNHWDGGQHRLYVHWDGSGIWEGFIPGIKEFDLYKFRIYSHHDDLVRDKIDPFTFATETPPKTSGVINSLKYKWKNRKWLNKRQKLNGTNQAISIYELHLGSWKKKNFTESLSYRDMADELVTYLQDMHFTHVEFMPITEHPYFPSWGYLCTSYFAPTNRYGSPTDLMYLIDQLHQANIGVILDWVPSHFPFDEFALANFDGSSVYEHPEKAKGFHPDWNSLIFNYERPEVRSFLISSAHFWLDKYKIDGIRVDAVASILYLDYSRETGEWSPNRYGGNQYLAAIDFLKDLNASCYGRFPGIHMIAEESTSFEGVTKPVHHGGLGFGYKWMMGWMNDSLDYFKKDPIHRKHHHNEISFSMAYAYSERYVLPLSHDEVVHGKRSLLSKMPGDDWQKFANLRLLYGYMFAHPYPKLLFMGSELGMWEEWDVNKELPWDLLDKKEHKGIQALVRFLNQTLISESALHELDDTKAGFEWIDHSDTANSVLAFYRYSKNDKLVVIANFTPNTHQEYRIGVNENGIWKEILNTDDQLFGGSHFINDQVHSEDLSAHHKAYSIQVKLAPLALSMFKLKKTK